TRPSATSIACAGRSLPVGTLAARALDADGSGSRFSHARERAYAALASAGVRPGTDGKVRARGDRRDLSGNAQRQELGKLLRPQCAKGAQVLELVAVAARDRPREQHADAERV